LALPATNVAFLPFYAAHYRGFYREEGIDLELLFMSAPAASTALFAGAIDYNGSVNSVISAAIRNQPAKVLIFTLAGPLHSLVGRNGITTPAELKGRKLGISATIITIANEALKHLGLEPGRDVSLVPISISADQRLEALAVGRVDAVLLQVPENIIALRRGYNELLFLGDTLKFPQNGFGTTVDRIRRHPDEVYKMVRATLRGLMFVADKKNSPQARDIVMKQWQTKDPSLAGEMLQYLKRGLIKDTAMPMDSIQRMVDSNRENSKGSPPVSAATVVDFSFLDRARNELRSSH
jgi:ABC-type nitrate/sulfonate/bicarbonate transport system substrate-binding protein